MTDEQMVLGRQAQKSKNTREKILNSAISLIKEGGFSAASASRIAERAGITWGAAQHHFGSKEDILDAVMAISHEKFIARVSDPRLREGSLSDRVDAFVDCMWAHYQDDVYLAGLEILLANRKTNPDAARMATFEQRAREHIKTLREIFYDCDLTDEQLREALIVAHCLLTGLTIEKVLETELHGTQRHLRRCKIMLLTAISNV
ncbi:MAG TPA: TetR/AcrR family transcriptional regulator [Alphaproteobacteria bacterium]|nr:TetR/AcrR family transcriptional regulator [Alphaproteobacteria bacterium]